MTSPEHELLEAIAPTSVRGSLAWQDDALCAQTGGELHFPAVGETAKPAQRLCALCPVTGVDGPCASYALDNFIRDGVWGGTTREDRKAIWKQRGRSVPDIDDDEESAA